MIQRAAPWTIGINPVDSRSPQTRTDAPVFEPDRCQPGDPDIAPGYLRRPHWLWAEQALLAASQTGRPIDLQWAFDTIVAAMDAEGWFRDESEEITHKGRPYAMPDDIAPENAIPFAIAKALSRRAARFETGSQARNSSSSALAFLKSSGSKHSVNQS